MKDLKNIKPCIKRIPFEAPIPLTEYHPIRRGDCRPSQVVWGRFRTEYFYQNIETKAEYRYLMGGFAPPGDILPGFALVVGLDRNEDPTLGKQIIRVLAEIEAPSLYQLVLECIRLQRRYGAYPLLYNGWASNIDEVLQNQISDITVKISQATDRRVEFFALPGAYSCYPDSSFKNYLDVLAENQGIIDRGTYEKLKGYMDSVRFQDRSKLKPEDNPATAALAYAVAELLVYEPWKRDVVEPYIPDDADDEGSYWDDFA